jgi:phage repressor protein C with HTH and peptisase S24 domain
MQKKSLIKQNILLYLDFIGLSPYKFYQETGITRGILTQDNGMSEENTAKFLAHYKNINPEWLLTGQGSMLKNEIEPEIKIDTKTLQVKGIPMLPFDAFAGIGDSSITGVNFDTIEERYVVPLFDGIIIDFMIPVRGSSMYPKYSSGDVVACRLVNELLFVQWNKVYVIDSISQGVIMKRLLKGETSDYVICKSDNKEYGEFNVPMNDIRSIALVVGVIRLE